MRYGVHKILPRWPAVTLTINPQESNHVVSNGCCIFPVSFLMIAQGIHEILW